ncbi:hypothetical protein BGZ51_000890 [Haplosporangium sp. Z 767]|nr:hypothetical protein BGZ51_000890 [Haplosporangium sp. Z 767]KAF9196140.1 hypothetical protein BGZ50_001836 [Haplosporangium sp. Z 11]
MSDPIKDISFWGGMALLISNMTGPGLVTLPIVAQSAGWLPTLFGFGVVATLSMLSSLFICEAMTEVPGNEYFQSNVEFFNLVECFFGRRYHLFVQVICFLAMQTTNIASIAVSSQLFDNLLIKIFHRTCGLQIYPHMSLVCVSEQLPSASPFSGVMIMTAGVLLAFTMILPLALLKLSENIWLQLASFILMLLIVLQWIVTFFNHGLDTTLVPAVGSDISQTFGTILFNYAFITTVPSWANAKQPNVSIHKTVGCSVTITTTIYLMVAIIGGMAFKIPSNSSLIQAISSSSDVTILSQIAGYTFPIAALITSIPINIIVIRYNLIQSGACNMLWSNVLAGVLPWMVAIPCMTGSGLTAVINWSSLFLVSTANFIIPFILYIYSKKHRERLCNLPVIEMEQHARLSREISRNSFSSYSRRVTSVSGSIRRRPTSTSVHPSSQSQLDLSIAPPTGIVAVSTIPLAVGIGSGNLIQHSTSEENLVGKSSRLGIHRRYHSHHSAGLGLSSLSEVEEPVSGGPYFSYSRDGELFERESKIFENDPSGYRSQPSSVYRPSGVSTVILHDPVTEMAQRKAALSRRVSNKDKILSMISEKHKRAMEQQARREQEEQDEKPVPPMILLSQSIVPYSDEDTQTSGQGNGPYESEKRSPVNTDNDFRDHPKECSDRSAAIKKLNRKSSVIAPLNQSRFTLSLPLSSPSLQLDTSVFEFKESGEFRPETPFKEKSGHAMESSPTFSPPRSPSSPQRSPSKRSSSNSPKYTSAQGNIDNCNNESVPRHSITLSPCSSKDSLMTDIAATDESRLGLGSGSIGGGSASSFSFQLHRSPSASDSSTNGQALDRRVSFSDQPRMTLSPPELVRKSSFSEETRRAMKAAVATLRGVSPNRLGKDEKKSSREWKQSLLNDHEIESEESRQGDSQEADDEEREDIGPELSLESIEKERGRLSDTVGQRSEARRDSVGRMAAAFVSQPGAFSIQTAITNSSPLVARTNDSAVQSSNTVPTLSFSVVELCQDHDKADLGSINDMEQSQPTLTLSSSAPPSFPTGECFGHHRSRTVSASAELQERSTRAQRYTNHAKSTISLKEKKYLDTPHSNLSIHLTPPSLSLQRTQSDASVSERLAEDKDRVGPLLASAPPSPQKTPSPTSHHHHASFGNGRHSRLSSSSKTLAAPFQGGNNYSIPGFSPSHPPVSAFIHHPHPTCPANHDLSQSGQGSRSSWFGRHLHSRNPSHATMASISHFCSAGSILSSSRPSMVEVGVAGREHPVVEHLRDPSILGEESTETRLNTATVEADELERNERQLHESNFHLPQYTSQVNTRMFEFDARWSVRAIPTWVPISSLKIAWGSLLLLAVAIAMTIVYDFVQLALGNDIVSGS